MSGTETIQPIVEKPHGTFNGVQKLYRFDNGYGASVVRFTTPYGAGSYGAESGLWEMAVIRWTSDGNTGRDFTIDYDTGITDDVLGHLDEDEVQEYLAKIRDLPAVTS